MAPRNSDAQAPVNPGPEGMKAPQAPQVSTTNMGMPPPPVPSHYNAGTSGVFNAPAQMQPPQHSPTPDYSEFDIDEELAKLEREAGSLRNDHSRALDDGIRVNRDRQPAEAQCAWMDQEGLVDGVVTDDSDAFLFGATHVYRNIFENKRYVEEYRASDIARELGLDRERLISLALLLGSDYTEGALHDLKQWVESPDTSLIAAAAMAAGKTGDRVGVILNEKTSGGVRESGRLRWFVG
eukprot:gene30424-35430_t